MNLLRELDGVKFINDSKATNVDSVWYALRSFDEPIFLILGGQDKGNNYDQIKDLVWKELRKFMQSVHQQIKFLIFFIIDLKVEIKKSMEDVVTSQVKKQKKVM